MVGKTSDGRELQFNHGDLLLTKVPGHYFVLNAWSGGIFHLYYITRNSPPEPYRCKTADMPSGIVSVLPFNKIGQGSSIEEMSEVLTKLELPDVTKVFPKEQRVNLNDENIQFSPDEVVNKYTKAVLLLDYLEKIVNYLFEKNKSIEPPADDFSNTYNKAFKQAMNAGITLDNTNYVYTDALDRIIPSDFVTPVPNRTTKTSTKKIRVSKLNTQVDTEQQETPVPGIQFADWKN